MNSIMKVLEGEKVLYSLKGKIPFPKNPVNIKSGRGGWELIKMTNPELLDVFEYEKDFDPVQTNELVNPVIQSGYRLSSYMFLVDTGTEIIKLMPLNPYNKYK